MKILVIFASGTLVIFCIGLHNIYVFGRSPKNSNTKYQTADDVRRMINSISARYETLINAKHLKSSYLNGFENRVAHARTTFRTLDRFFDEELEEIKKLEQTVQNKLREQQEKSDPQSGSMNQIADEIIQKHKETIAAYPALKIHPTADEEVRRLYGAISYLDKHYWAVFDSYLHKAYPQAGQIDRMSLEQRFWRLISPREGRLPEDLERYYQVLVHSSLTIERLTEARETIKNVAFFLHDLIQICENAKERYDVTEELKSAIQFVRKIIDDFRLQIFQNNNNNGHL